MGVVYILFLLFIFFQMVILQDNYDYDETEEKDDSSSSASAEENDIYQALYAALNNYTTTLRPSYSSTSSSTTTLKTIVIEDDDDDYGKLHEWKTKDALEGYEINSDGLQFKSKLEKETHMVHIRINVDTSWTLKIQIHRRNLELTIVTWERTNRVHIKVPYGVMPEELEVVETTKYIDVYAPYGFLEVQQSST